MAAKRQPPRSAQVHARCGKPWDEHDIVEPWGFPRCSDEGTHPTEQVSAGEPE